MGTRHWATQLTMDRVDAEREQKFIQRTHDDTGGKMVVEDMTGDTAGERLSRQAKRDERKQRIARDLERRRCLDILERHRSGCGTHDSAYATLGSAIHAIEEESSE